MRSVMLNAPKFDENTSPYRDAWALVALRNALFHHKPSWDPARHREVNLVKELEGRFLVSPFPHEGADFVTMKCMSHGCARWAVETVLRSLASSMPGPGHSLTQRKYRPSSPPEPELAAAPVFGELSAPLLTVYYRGIPMKIDYTITLNYGDDAPGDDEPSPTEEDIVSWIVVGMGNRRLSPA